MGIGRRQMLLGGLSIGVATAGGPRQSLSRKEIELEAFSTYGVVPGGGELDQTATLQDACDRAAQSGIPFFLPAGSYRTGTLELKSGLQIEGMPGKSILIHNGGGSL